MQNQVTQKENIQQLKTRSSPEPVSLASQVCVQSSMMSRFNEKLLYSFLHRIRCSIVTH
jgi:hypothetical protein